MISVARRGPDLTLGRRKGKKEDHWAYHLVGTEIVSGKSKFHRETYCTSYKRKMLKRPADYTQDKISELGSFVVTQAPWCSAFFPG